MKTPGGTAGRPSATGLREFQLVLWLAMTGVALVTLVAFTPWYPAGSSI